MCGLTLDRERRVGENARHCQVQDQNVRTLFEDDFHRPGPVEDIANDCTPTISGKHVSERDPGHREAVCNDTRKIRESEGRVDVRVSVVNMAASLRCESPQEHPYRSESYRANEPSRVLTRNR